MSYLDEYFLCTRQNFKSNFVYQKIQLCTTLRAAIFGTNLYIVYGNKISSFEIFNGL